MLWSSFIHFFHWMLLHSCFRLDVPSLQLCPEVVFLDRNQSDHSLMSVLCWTDQAHEHIPEQNISCWTLASRLRPSNILFSFTDWNHVWVWIYSFLISWLFPCFYYFTKFRFFKSFYYFPVYPLLIFILFFAVKQIKSYISLQVFPLSSSSQVFYWQIQLTRWTNTHDKTTFFRVTLWLLIIFLLSPATLRLNPSETSLDFLLLLSQENIFMLQKISTWATKICFLRLLELFGPPYCVHKLIFSLVILISSFFVDPFSPVLKM